MSISCTGQIQTDANGYPLCVGGDWSQSGLYQLLESVLSTPTDVQIQAAFTAGFVLPVIAYLTAWAYQSVIGFVSRDRY